MSWIDKVIESISPKSALERKQARLKLKALDAVAQDRLREDDWDYGSNILEKTPNKIFSSDINKLINVARNLYYNNHVVHGVVQRIINHTVGTGLIPQPDLTKLGFSQEKQAEIEEEIETEWEYFALNPERCDAYKKLTFNEQQQLIIKRILIDGEIFPRFVKGNSLLDSFAIEMIGRERIDSSSIPKTGLNLNVKDGIEFTTEGAEKAYAVFKYDSTGLKSLKTEWIQKYDANGDIQMFHLFETNEPGQTRGCPEISAVLTEIEDLARFREAAIMKERIAACLSILLENSSGNPYGSNASKNTDGNYEIDIEPGLIKKLPPGLSAKVIDPNRGQGSFDQVTKSIYNAISVAYTYPVEVLFGDFSGRNYSSSRAAIIESKMSTMIKQNFLIHHFLDAVYKKFLKDRIISGKIGLTMEQIALINIQWYPPANIWVDPKDEMDATDIALRLKTTTLAAESRKRGTKWKDNILQRAREQAYEQEVNKKFNIEQKQDPQNPNKDSENPNNQNDQEDENGESEESGKENTESAV